jgi:hypothetical protein
VVSEANTSPATFSRTKPSPPKQRTNSRPPSTPLTSQCARANSLAWVHSLPRRRSPSARPAAGRAQWRQCRRGPFRRRRAARSPGVTCLAAAPSGCSAGQRTSPSRAASCAGGRG